MGVQICVGVSAFSYFGLIPWSGIAGSHDNSMFNIFEEPLAILAYSHILEISQVLISNSKYR